MLKTIKSSVRLAGPMVEILVVKLLLVPLLTWLAPTGLDWLAPL